MKIFFIGDIVGRPGRETVKKLLPEIKEQHAPDLIIANGENMTHGRGLSEETVQELIKAGVHFFTSGNHVYANKNVVSKLDDKSFPVIRPANFPPGNPGRGYHLLEAGNMQQVLVINLMTRVFMKHDYDCPFRTFDEIIKEHQHLQNVIVFVDLHGEASSEKAAFAHYIAGKASAVVGTHTHVPTTDARIISGGTAFITDVGMVGVEDSIIGVTKEPIIQSFLTQMPVKHEIGDGPTIFCGVLIEINDITQKATKITQVIEHVD